MSTILDSLKKSSNKRDDSKQTSINSFNFSNSKKTSKSGLFMIIILMIITAATLYYGYKYINNQTDSSKIATDIQGINADVNEQQNTQTDSIVLVAEQNTNQAKKLQKPNIEVVKKQLSEAKQFQDNKVITLAESQNNNTGQIAKIKNDANKVASQPSSKPIKQESQEKDSSNPSKTTAEKPMIKLSMPNENNSPQKPKRKPQVATQEYMYVYQLPFAVRKEIPKFKLNIHIFDENPENRVVVINGTKFAVDDLIEEQILVKKIVREGVLLEYNGNVFLVPVL